ncbi:MAG: UTP--glucose-1-phosphate uridylyltransferase, partial [Myxococcota bacterium]
MRLANPGERALNDRELARFADQMRKEGQPEIATRHFLDALRLVSGGAETTIPEAAIEPVVSLPEATDLIGFTEAGRAAAMKTVVIKLNGGLGTSMGLLKAKSLLPVRPGLSFLDLIARQVLWQREHGAPGLALVLMNGERTRDDSLAALAGYSKLETELPLDFLQHKVPRIDAATWTPVESPKQESLAWCPPGHGDLYLALESSGMLEKLRSKGIRYAFVSNADNLGAVLDFRILGWFATKKIPFAMEVVRRREADRKGGHLARRKGRLLLRELAQCSADDLDSFQDIDRHRYFNTNNLWLDLDAVDRKLSKGTIGLEVPIMKNLKPVRPDQSSSPLCIQLETAMGAAIESFDRSEAIVVSRDRFVPVKTTNDLLRLWSDAYQLGEDARMRPADVQTNRIRVIDLDPKYFGTVDDLQARFPAGAP